MINKVGKLAIIGAGGHGKVLKEIAQLNGFLNIFFFDDYKIPDDNNFYGDTKKLLENQNEYEFFFVAIGNNLKRKEKIQLLLKRKLNIINLIHPSAIISKSVKLQKGIAIMANATINANTTINYGSIVNTSSTIDHDCEIGSYVHICPGVKLAGNVKLGDLTWIGIGSTIIENINIEDEVIVGAGGVVINNIKRKLKVKGIPAK
ncbi:MAG: acetyltransferase [Alphaproteobacteria bacterium]